MKNRKIFKFATLMVALAVIATGCGNSNKGNEKDTTEAVNNDKQVSETVEVKDIHGTVEVKVKPEKVIALDNRTFETLSDWDIELAAAPKDVMPEDSPYVKNENVKNIGDHKEPNLEIIAAEDPDLIIVGQRFASFYDEIKKIAPNATIVDFSFDVSGEKEEAGKSLEEGLKNATLDLGKIFDKNEEAKKLVDDFEKSIDDSKKAYDGKSKIMSVVVSGGEIGFSAPTSGRVWGPMYEIFDWKSALEVDGSSSDHKGDDISVEAIAESNPDWIFVLDRDAAVSSDEESVPAKDVIENSPALKNTTAITKGQLVYAPNDTYTNESIQTYIELFENIANSLNK